MDENGPTSESSVDESTQTASVALTRGEIETAMEANGLSREVLGDEAWDRQVALEMAMASGETTKATPSTPAPADASLSSDVPLGAAFAATFKDRDWGIDKPPSGGMLTHDRIDDAEYYAKLHPLREADWDCETCEDAKFVKVPHQPEGVAVLGVATLVSEAIPCPDCNSSSSVPLYLDACRVQGDWLDLTLADFKPLPGKTAARDLADRWIKQLDDTPDHVLMFGGNGVGKSMLVSIMVVAACRAERRAVLWNVGALMRELQSRFGSDEESAQMLMQALGMVPVLALDDWGQEMKTASGWSVSELEALIEERYSQGRPTIVTTNLGRSEFAQHVEGRVASRMLDFRRVDVQGDDMRGQR